MPDPLSFAAFGSLTRSSITPLTGTASSLMRKPLPSLWAQATPQGVQKLLSLSLPGLTVNAMWEGLFVSDEFDVWAVAAGKYPPRSLLISVKHYTDGGKFQAVELDLQKAGTFSHGALFWLGPAPLSGRESRFT